MEVEWRDLAVTVGSKQILAPCSGHLKPGRMTALMGPSGCGKSTLLNCLRQTIPHAGEVRFDGSRFCQDLRQLIGFTEQDDVVIPQLTVRQSLRFLADLRFGIGSKAAVDHVEQALMAMRLKHIADSVIGEAGRSPRISGGERRRLCIARELLAEPKLLLCDEPTSGLDSTMADQVVASMRELSDRGSVSVIAAIHQPSSNIFGRFDDLLLVREGQLLYSGPASEAEALFTSYGIPRSPSQSTAEYLMDLLVLGGGDDQKAGLLSPDMRGELARSVRSKAASLPPLGPPSKAKMVDRRYAAPVGRQLAVLVRRHGTLMLRAIFTKFGAVQNLGLMLVAALVWVQLGYTEDDVFPRWGVAMWTLGTWMFFPMFGALGTFASFHRVLEKELSVGCYSLESFYLARTLLLLPLEWIWPTIWTTGVYWVSNANPHFTVFLSVLCLVFLSYSVFQGIGLTVSASAMSPEAANTLMMLIITYFFAWAGFFVDLSHLPDWIAWLQYPNPFRYAVQLMVQIIVTDDLEFVCSGDGSVGVQDVSVGCERTSAGALVLTGARARLRHKIELGPWVCLAVLAATLLVFRTLAYLLLRRDLRTAIHGAKESGLSPSLPETPAGHSCKSIVVDVPADAGAEKLPEDETEAVNQL